MSSGGSQDSIQIDDPALAGGEWLFQRGGQVFGPIDSHALAVMLYRGELDASTPVSTGDGAWAPVASVRIFVLHAKKAEAALRVEREVTGARLLARRKSRLRAAGALALGLGVVGGGIFVGYRLATRPPPDHALLQDFGSGIRIASGARIGTGRLAREQEVEVTFDPAAPAAPRKAPAGQAARAPAPATAGDVEGGALVAARWDEGQIQSVVAREQRNLAPCFRTEARRSPDFRGDIPIEFAIGNDGRVAELWIDEPRFRQGPLRDCLFRALRAWKFAPFPGQRPTVSLAFRIDG